MEPEGSLPLSQQLAICPFPEPDSSNTRPKLFQIHSNIILSSIHNCSKCFFSGFPTKKPYIFLPPLCVPHAPPSLLALISLIKFHEQYKKWRFSWRSFIQAHFPSSLLSPKIFLSALFLKSLSLCSSPNARAPIFIPLHNSSWFFK